MLCLAAGEVPTAALLCPPRPQMCSVVPVQRPFLCVQAFHLHAFFYFRFLSAEIALGRGQRVVAI